MKKYIAILAAAAICWLSGCTQDDYVANVTELRLVGVSPAEGYSGSIVKVLGRNFSTSFGENKVIINGKSAKIIEFTKDDITFIAPDNERGTYPVVVVSQKDTISEGWVTFTYKQKPEKLYSVTTVAGTGANSLSDGLGTSAAVGGIEGLCFAPDGKIWFCQRNGGYAIRTYDPATSLVATVASGTELPWGGGFDSKGDFYFAAKAVNKVFKVTSSGAVSEYNTGAALNNPMYVKFDSKDNLWVCCRNTHTVYKTKDGAVLETYTADGYYPTAMYIDSKDRVFFASTNNACIYMIENGAVTKIAGVGTKPVKDTFAGSFASGNPMDAQIGAVGAITIAADGTLYYTDFTTFVVVKIVPDAEGDYSKGKISILAGLPYNNAVVNGKSDAAKFKYPSGIEVSPDGKKVYVSEPTGFVLRQIEL